MGIARAHERHRAGMTEHLPITLGVIDRGLRALAFEGFASDQTMVGQIDRHCEKLSEFSHRLAFHFFCEVNADITPPV